MSRLGLKATNAKTDELVSEMGAGQTFEFTSKVNKNNSGPYLKLNSKGNKAVNLLTFKSFLFGDTDRGTPFDAELIRK